MIDDPVQQGRAEDPQVAPLLPYFDVDPRKVRFLGTGLWDDPALGREPTLVGGWFAAPPPQGRAEFMDRFDATFDRAADPRATLAYDAVALAAVLARQDTSRDAFGLTALTSPNGFAGTDGIFRLLPSGAAERGLSVLEVDGREFAAAPLALLTGTWIDPRPPWSAPDYALMAPEDRPPLDLEGQVSVQNPNDCGFYREFPRAGFRV